MTLQDRGKDDPIDTLENRIKFWINIISNARGPEPDSLYDYDYNDEGLDETVRGWERREFPERRALKIFLDKHRSKGLRKTLKLFINENYLKPLKKNYATNKADVYHLDDIWSLDILDLKDYDSKNNRGYRYVLVFLDNFSKFGWTIPLKYKNAQTIKDSFGNNLISSKRKPNLIESDREKEFFNKNFQDSLNKNNMKISSRNSSYGAVFAEKFNRTIRDLLKKTVFEKGDGNWIDVLPTITKQYNN